MCGPRKGSPRGQLPALQPTTSSPGTRMTSTRHGLRKLSLSRVAGPACPQNGLNDKFNGPHMEASFNRGTRVRWVSGT